LDDTVDLTQLIFGSLLVAALLALAAYFTWAQLLTFRRLRTSSDLPSVERDYQRRQAWRRLLGCGLMGIFAGLLVGSFWLERPARELIEQREAAADEGESPDFTPDQRDFAKLFGWYWIALLAVLLAILVVAALDLLATRNYGIRQFRQLQADRRAMIEHQAARLRHQRNGFQ
jgi:hypothetical protein